MINSHRNLLWSGHWPVVFHKQTGTLLYSLFVSWSFYWQSNGRVDGFTMCTLSDAYDLFIKVAQLKTLAERGVITYIAKRLQRIQKDLRRVGGKARMTHDEALAEIIDMAKKYAPYYTAQESLLNEQETEAEIILSESFN